MAKKKIKKGSMEKLDEINCLWILKQISLGNVIRGLAFVAGIVGDIKNCITEKCSHTKKKNTGAKQTVTSEQQESEKETKEKSSGK